jgi:hypothetical protein
MCDEDKYLNIGGIQPSVWGKSGWIFLDSIGLVYDPSKKKSYKKFFTALPEVLPCDECGDNLKAALPGLEDALETKKSLLSWLLGIRNGISKETGGKQLTRQDIIFEIFNSKNDNKCQYVWVFIMILILILFIYIFKSFSKKDNKESSVIESSL